MNREWTRLASWGLGGLFLCWLALAGCSSGPEQGPVPVRWDQQACERCGMVLSDRRYAAEIREPLAGDRSRVHFFDDFGCAVLWLADKPWRGDSRTEFWVKDWRNGHWIDARHATYITGKHTPMDYGLAAQSDPAPGGLTYRQAVARVQAVEEKGAHAIHHGEAGHLESIAPGSRGP